MNFCHSEGNKITACRVAARTVRPVAMAPDETCPGGANRFPRSVNKSFV